MLKKTRPPKDVPTIHLFICVLLVCLSVHTWKLFGCFGFPECYLCRTFTPDYLLHPSPVSSYTNDFTKLMDMENFTFLMNSYACNNSTELLLLVLVHSDPRNHEKRTTIRSTWGKVNGDGFKLLFLLGIPNSTVLQHRLHLENDVNGDLVQGNFIDTYRNLTYKHVMALKWTKYFCPQAKYLLKTDDDVFVNSPSFLHYLDNLPAKRLMRCLPVHEGRAQRTSRSKWRVTWSEYKFRRYPLYCQGFAILYSPDVALALYAKAQIADYFWIDDVFITGFLAMSANFTPSTFGKFMLEPEDFQRRVKDDESDTFSYLLGPWNLSVADIRRLWEMALKAGRVRTVAS